MSLGPWQLIIIALVILVLFGRGKISEMMGDFGKGIKSFKEGMSEEEREAARESPRIEGPARDAAPRTETKPMHEAKPAGETLDKSQIHTPSDSQ